MFDYEKIKHCLRKYQKSLAVSHLWRHILSSMFCFQKFGEPKCVTFPNILNSFFFFYVSFRTTLQYFPNDFLSVSMAMAEMEADTVGDKLQFTHAPIRIIALNAVETLKCVGVKQYLTSIYIYTYIIHTFSVSAVFFSYISPGLAAEQLPTPRSRGNFQAAVNSRAQCNLIYLELYE